METSESPDYFYYHENFTFNISYDDYPSLCEKSDVRSFASLFLPIVYLLCLILVTKCLALTHCCINPLLYTFVGSSFRRHLVKAAKRLGENNRSRRQRAEEMSFDSQSESQQTNSFSI
uniref:G-protein coupled receptors family 1 profile domain-containing protein n=1 Tax=Knipowitschia caucasica TaxID=637954 RepID=A0AAV2JRQ6_KNICA